MRKEILGTSITPLLVTISFPIAATMPSMVMCTNHMSKVVACSSLICLLTASHNSMHSPPTPPLLSSYANFAPSLFTTILDGKMLVVESCTTSRLNRYIGFNPPHNTYTQITCQKQGV